MESINGRQFIVLNRLDADRRKERERINVKKHDTRKIITTTNEKIIKKLKQRTNK
jgi:hypothetical protein